MARWADARSEWLDKVIDSAVEARATRKSDAKRLAIEHTIIEPFVGEKSAFAGFESAFLKIEDDDSSALTGRHITVWVPVGTWMDANRQYDRG